MVSCSLFPAHNPVPDPSPRPKPKPQTQQANPPKQHLELLPLLLTRQRLELPIDQRRRLPSGEPLPHLDPPSRQVRHLPFGAGCPTPRGRIEQLQVGLLQFFVARYPVFS